MRRTVVSLLWERFRRLLSGTSTSSFARVPTFSSCFAKARAIAVKERRWPPNTLQEHRRIVARNLRALHDVDVAKITTHTLDVLYAERWARQVKGRGAAARTGKLLRNTSCGSRCSLIVRSRVRDSAGNAAAACSPGVR
jgi:hypothetical protein